MTVAAIKGQSQQLFVSRHLKNARVQVLDAMPPQSELESILLGKCVDAFAINRQRGLDAQAATALVSGSASRADAEVRRLRTDLRLTFADLLAVQDRGIDPDQAGGPELVGPAHIDDVGVIGIDGQRQRARPGHRPRWRRTLYHGWRLLHRPREGVFQEAGY